MVRKQGYSIHEAKDEYHCLCLARPRPAHGLGAAGTGGENENSFHLKTNVTFVKVWTLKNITEHYTFRGLPVNLCFLDASSEVMESVKRTACKGDWRVTWSTWFVLAHYPEIWC